MPFLASTKQTTALTTKLRAERMSLLAAAEDLQRRVLPGARRLIAAGRARALAYHAATHIQAFRRGLTLRRQLTDSGILERHRARAARAKLRAQAGRLQARVVGSKLLMARLQAPLYRQRSPNTESGSSLGLPRDLWAAMRYAHISAVARSFSASVNRTAASAPESSQLRLPLSPLGLLTSGPIELTALIEANLNATTVADLKLPTALTIVRLKVNDRLLNVRGNALHATKLLVGDALTLRGLPHAFSTATEVRGGRLVLSPHKLRKGWGEGLRRDHAQLVKVAHELARRLQALANVRLAQRSAQRRAHAALVIQVSWVRSRAQRGSEVSFIKRGGDGCATGGKGGTAEGMVLTGGQRRSKSPPLRVSTAELEHMRVLTTVVAPMSSASSTATTTSRRTQSSVSSAVSSAGRQSGEAGGGLGGWAAVRRKRLVIQAAGAMKQEGLKYRQKRKPDKGKLPQRLSVDDRVAEAEKREGKGRARTRTPNLI